MGFALTSAKRSPPHFRIFPKKSQPAFLIALYYQVSTRYIAAVYSWLRLLQMQSRTQTAQRAPIRCIWILKPAYLVVVVRVVDAERNEMGNDNSYPRSTISVLGFWYTGPGTLQLVTVYCCCCTAVPGGPCTVVLVCASQKHQHTQQAANGTTPHSASLVNPFRTAVPLWGQTTQISSSLSPKRDCGP